MFGIGFGEMLIIAVILLIAVGPRQLPQLMKTVGKGMREVKRATNDLRRSTGIDELLNDDELRNPLRQETKPQRQPLRPSDRERESPSEGVDLAHARTLFQASAPVSAPVPGPSSKPNVEAGGSAPEQTVEAGGSTREQGNEG